MANGKTSMMLVAAALAGLAAAVLWLQPYSAEWPGTGFTRPAQRYLRAAIHEDSSALVRLSVSIQSVTWALRAARTQPRVLAAWGHDAQAWIRGRPADTTDVFVFNASDTICPTAPISVRFVGSGRNVRVLEVGSTCFDQRVGATPR